MQTTRDQVAKEAKVSSATVSRVFNNNDSVSDELKQKVLKAAKKLNYIPNKAASQLRRRGTGKIAVVKINKEDRIYYWGSIKLFDWFYAQAQKGMLNAIENTSYQLSFYTINEKSDLIQICKKVDAIIGYDIDTINEESFFNNLPIPCILAHHIKPNNTYLHVSTDNLLGGVLQGEYLKSKNVVKPIYISGYINKVYSHSQRLEGIKQIYPNIEVVEFDFMKQIEIKKITEYISNKIINNEVDGIAFVNDLVLAKTLFKINCNIPIIGYDGAPYISLIDNVASIEFHIDKIYELAIDKVISILNDKNVEGEIIYPSIIE